MEVIFLVNGTRYTIEIGSFDTVHDMKEAFERKHGFPVARMTLLYNGELLKDEHNTQHYGICEGCYIKVILKPERRIAQVMVNGPNRRYPLEIDVLASVGFLKQKIREVEKVPTERLLVMHAGIELEVHRRIADYGVSNQSEISVVIKPRTPPTMRVLVQTKSDMIIPVDVSPADTVQDVKMKLEDMGIAPDEHFFVYKEDVMTDNHTLRWHDVRDGHILRLFRRTITGD